jgi:2'-5' RNA ligase
MQLKSYREYQEERTEFGCLMAYFEFPSIIDIRNQISENDILEDFRDSGEPHVTILFGFHLDETNYKDIAEDCKNLIKQPIDDIRIINISTFENEEYDVLKFTVESETLTSLNNYFRNTYPYTNNFPDYNPHITIDYLKPGSGDKYVNSLDISEAKKEKIICDKVVYSMGNSYYKPFYYVPSEREIL